MTLAHAQASEKSVRLMQGIGALIQQFTLTSPMTPEDVIGVLAFCAGSAIGNAPSPHTKGQLRQMAMANIDHGLTAALQAGKPLIII